MIKYIPGLNGIRAIAVLLVIISHRFPKDHFIHVFPLGSYGVDIFFVLSGFLISRSLFYQIKKNDEHTLSRLKIVKNFFFRRILRIFPIYYLLLIFLFLTGGIIGNEFKSNILWYVFYGVNYLNYYENKWFGALGHFWSLSVEEQFYIFWPLLLLFVFKKRILYLIFFMIIIGTIYPFFLDGKTSVLTLSCVNAFGIGALLAYFEIIKPNYKSLFNTILRIVFFPILVLICINKMVVLIPYFSDRLAISILAVSVIGFCRYRSKHVLVTQILENKTLNFIGIISYGIYLYHNVVPKYWVLGCQKNGLGDTSVNLYVLIFGIINSNTFYYRN
jgi:peptidoglycan/LPS O-acetylase OafA/YrhL